MSLPLFVGLILLAQTVSPRTLSPIPSTTGEFLTNAPSNGPTSAPGNEYRIGRDDLVDVSVFDVPELTTSARISATGALVLPLIGPVDAAGKTIQELQHSIEEALRAKYLNDPHVTLFVREYASQPVSVMGAVKVPGIYQIKGEKSLLDMIAMAQGLDASSAGKTIQIIRRNSSGSPNVDSSSVPGKAIDIDLEDLFDNGNTALNVPIIAGDVINVVRAGSVFVVGEVTHPSEFVLHNGKNVTVTQAVALASGTTKDAKKQGCVIIRYHRDRTKEEIPVDYDKVLRGTAMDVMMLPNDILFVPANKVKSTLNRALESTITVAMGRLIYVGF
jgi:polysaccharide export outer membrane protein